LNKEEHSEEEETKDIPNVVGERRPRYVYAGEDAGE